MCGRYDIVDVAKLQERFALENLPPRLEADADITPGQLMPVVLQARSERRLELMSWGLIPVWAKDRKIGYSTINARAETVASKPAFRRSFQTKRCLAPASGFYEWQQTASGKVRYRFSVNDEELFAFAGLYDVWHGPDGQEIASYTIITTTANELVAPIHDRMPVILPRKAEGEWLAREVPAERLSALLVPYGADRMAATPVPLLISDHSFLQPALL